jgi:hypothetical protein
MPTDSQERLPVLNPNFPEFLKTLVNQCETAW